MARLKNMIALAPERVATLYQETMKKVALEAGHTTPVLALAELVYYRAFLKCVREEAGGGNGRA